MSVESKGFAGALSGGAPVRHSRISGIGGYRPKRVVPNAEIVDLIDSSDEWIRERSGIIERRFAGPDEGIIEMTEWAAQPALEMAGIEGKDLDAVIMATVTWPYQTPAAAPIIADRLGLRCAAFDISAACAGYCHGISLANDMVRGGSARFVLVIGVEKLTDFTDVTDRGTAFIFADGAGAAVVGPSDFPGIGPTIWGSDGSQWETIKQKESWLDVRDQGLDHPTIEMAGQSVFRWAVWSMAPVARAAIEAALSLGASKGHIFRTVTLPLLIPGLAGSFLLLFVESLADLGNPLLLSGNSSVLATDIYLAVNGQFDQQKGAAFSLVLLIPTLTIFLLQRYYVGKRSYVAVTGKPTGGQLPVKEPLIRWSFITVTVLTLILVMALYFSILWGSFTTLWGINYTLNLGNYATAFSRGLNAILSTTFLSAVALAATVLFWL